MKSANGLTLIEILVTMAISGFVLTAINSIYKTQQQSYVAQEQTAAIQQNLRGGIYCMYREIRMAGYDPQLSGGFGIVDISLDNLGNGTITFTLDDNLNSVSNESDGNGVVDDKETFVYSLYDYPTAAPDGILDLGRKYGSSRKLLAENIEALGLAYAFDTKGDGDNFLDTDINGNIIWAIDSDGDKDLDVNLDENNDGEIDIKDSAKGKDLSHVDNGGLADVPLSDIRAVRIWLLARGDRSNSHQGNNRIHVVANQRISTNDGFKRRLLTTTVRCRNMWVAHNN